ncbi:hypothetical protein OG594_44580 [Streptomyces sp. NBC_01214]|uniref:hypothetical protein n=1 Tax=Streptomyces sp. NBC_01214 TaxID=2903777 RepID=UPI00225BBAED|nr:hypothetical protein [Streptomyces sp. NBC_01214]MCX4808581.1 hypothetical protein [Streptomyces sp. NBC_01214]
MEKAGQVAAWLAIALVGLFAGVMSAMEVSGALEREREYRASPVCASVPVTASACVWEQAFTVRERRQRGRRWEGAGGDVAAPERQALECGVP